MPNWLTYSFTAFVAVLVPVYWRTYGPANFLWFSDLALFAIAISLWTAHPLPVSMLAVGVLLLEAGWTVDFVLLLIAGASPTGLSEYMRSESIPAAVRAVSLFHLALPPLFLWMTRRLGYDRRAWAAQSALALVVLPITYLISEPDRNVNWVYGPVTPQRWMPPLAWLAVLWLGLVLVVYPITHGLLIWWTRRSPSPRRA